MMERSQVKVLVITGVGLNCEKETAAAFASCGATAEQVHLNDLLNGSHKLSEYHILAFIGGFSFGDHLGSGTVFANRIKFRLAEELKEFVAAGKLVIGICNGFQTLTRLGLAPALNGKYLEQQAALTNNDCGVFRDDWITLKAMPLLPASLQRASKPCACLSATAKENSWLMKQSWLKSKQKISWRSATALQMAPLPTASPKIPTAP